MASLAVTNTSAHCATNQLVSHHSRVCLIAILPNIMQKRQQQSVWMFNLQHSSAPSCFARRSTCNRFLFVTLSLEFAAFPNPPGWHYNGRHNIMFKRKHMLTLPHKSNTRIVMSVFWICQQHSVIKAYIIHNGREWQFAMQTQRVINQ
jgi:hypothetical protein